MSDVDCRGSFEGYVTVCGSFCELPVHSIDAKGGGWGLVYGSFHYVGFRNEWSVSRAGCFTHGTYGVGI